MKIFTLNTLLVGPDITTNQHMTWWGQFAMNPWEHTGLAVTPPETRMGGLTPIGLFSLVEKIPVDVSHLLLLQSAEHDDSQTKTLPENHSATCFLVMRLMYFLILGHVAVASLVSYPFFFRHVTSVQGQKVSNKVKPQKLCINLMCFAFPATKAPVSSTITTKQLRDLNHEGLCGILLVICL